MTNREDAHDALGGRSAVPRYYRGIWPLSCGELDALTDLGMSAEQIAVGRRRAGAGGDQRNARAAFA